MADEGRPRPCAQEVPPVQGWNPLTFHKSLREPHVGLTSGSWRQSGGSGGCLHVWGRKIISEIMTEGRGEPRDLPGSAGRKQTGSYKGPAHSRTELIAPEASEEGHRMP